MLAEAAGVKKIVIACGRTDLRKSIDGLAQLISTGYDLNPFEKDVLFLFCGGKNDRRAVFDDAVRLHIAEQRNFPAYPEVNEMLPNGFSSTLYMDIKVCCCP